MRNLTSLFVLGSVLALSVACGDDGGDGGGMADAAPQPDSGQASMFSLSLTLSGYGMAHDGDTLYFALWDDTNTTAAVATAEKTIMSGGGGGGGGGGNTVSFADALVEGHSYVLYWYADVNANMTCDMGTDHHWSLAIPTVTADAVVSHTHSTTFNGDCTKQ